MLRFIFLLFILLPIWAENSAWLIGTWVFENEETQITMSFHKDGSYVASFGDGSWLFSEDILILQTSAGDTIEYTVEVQSSNSFSVTGGDLADSVLLFKKTKGTNTVPSVKHANKQEQSKQQKPRDGDNSPLVGTWLNQSQGSASTLTLYADGRYNLEIVVYGNKSSETGRYQINGNQITFYEQFGQRQSYEVSLVGNTLTFVNSEINVTYYKKSGQDQQHSTDEDVWRQRIAFGNPVKNSSWVQQIKLPRDPNPKAVFKNATVFTSVQHYVIMTQEFLRDRQGVQRRVFNKRSFYFGPDGRLCNEIINHNNGTVDSYQGITPEVKYFWGRYHIQNESEITVISDLGENITMRLQDARRNLVFGDATFTNILWEQEVAGQQQQNE